MLTLRVDGVPEPQARPRIWKFGRRLGMKSPKTGWYHAVLAEAIRRAPAAPLDGPVAVDAVFVFPRLKSVPARQVLKWTKADLDNLIKAVLDALVRARWIVDDGRVARSAEIKRYAVAGEAPGAIITLTPLEDPAYRRT